jgi:tripartite-type tricarboxylate transporter receptor subunit TctC
MKINRRLFGVVASCCSGMFVTSAFADPVSDFYHGKTVSIAVSTSAGGDYDQRARLLARHMDKHLPGQPKIIVQNMPGAGGLKAANWLYNIALKDGTALGSLGQNMPMTQVLGGKGVEFDLRQCVWIGNTMSSPMVPVSWYTSPVKTIYDALKTELVIGGTGAGASSVQVPQMLNNLLGTKFKIIAGYPGGNELYLGMERGEIAGRATQNWAGWKSQRPDWIRDKKINLLAQSGMKRHPELPDVPLLIDLAKTAEDKQVLELFLAGDDIARPIIAPPKVPDDRIAALRTAFDATMTDKGFLDDAAKGKIEIEPASGKEIEVIATRVLNTPPAVAAKARAALEVKDVIKELPKKGKSGD